MNKESSPIPVEAPEAVQAALQALSLPPVAFAARADSVRVAGKNFALPVRLGVIADAIYRAASASGIEQDIAFGPYRLAAGSDLLEGGVKPVRLTEKERALLLMLHNAAGGTVTRGALLDHIWGYAEGVETHTLETHIYRLRQKIENDPANPVYLITEEAGYRLVK